MKVKYFNSMKEADELKQSLRLAARGILGIADNLDRNDFSNRVKPSVFISFAEEQFDKAAEKIENTRRICIDYLESLSTYDDIGG